MHYRWKKRVQLLVKVKNKMESTGGEFALKKSKVVLQVLKDNNWKIVWMVITKIKKVISVDGWN